MLLFVSLDLNGAGHRRDSCRRKRRRRHDISLNNKLTCNLTSCLQVVAGCLAACMPGSVGVVLLGLSVVVVVVLLLVVSYLRSRQIYFALCLVFLFPLLLAVVLLLLLLCWSRALLQTTNKWLPLTSCPIIQQPPQPSGAPHAPVRQTAPFQSV